ncbi:MAG: SDR family NAD(P)-dependent oxidoreductase [Chlamydiota bacterium]
MKIFDRLLDKSIYFSFDRSGYKRHAKEFKNETFVGEGKVAIVTGANAGIGLGVTKALCQSGVKVHMLCRSLERGKKAVEEICTNQEDAQLSLLQVDVSEPKSIDAFLGSDRHQQFDIIVNNAGGMPEILTKNSLDHEIVWASHVSGHYRLTQGLIEQDQLRLGARVITVSSGGMYSQKLDLSDLNFQKSDYNKYTAYANAKRAQVILNELWHERYGEAIRFSCMHPGWVRTDGVRFAMPWFYWWMEKRLREVGEGADTVVWLALTREKYRGGQFWFDRKEAPVHLAEKTKESHKHREELLEVLNRGN